MWEGVTLAPRLAGCAASAGAPAPRCAPAATAALCWPLALVGPRRILRVDLVPPLESREEDGAVQAARDERLQPAVVLDVAYLLGLG